MQDGSKDSDMNVGLKSLQLSAAVAFAILLLALVDPISEAQATFCTCRPELKSNSTLEGGTCTKTQDNGYWCEMTWNGGTKSKKATRASLAPGASFGLSTFEASEQFVKELEKVGIKVTPDIVGDWILGDGAKPPSLFVAQALNMSDPKEYTVTTVRQFAVLMGAAIIQFHPKQVDMAISLFKQPESVLKAIATSKPKKISISRYRGIASSGCLILFDNKFRAMVKTRFSLYAGDCTDKELR